MKSTTAFFPAFGPLLFGRRPRRGPPGAAPTGRGPDALHQLEAAFGSLIPTRLLGSHPSGPGSRERLLPIPLAFWAFSPKCSRPVVLAAPSYANSKRGGPRKVSPHLRQHSAYAKRGLACPNPRCWPSATNWPTAPTPHASRTPSGADAASRSSMAPTSPCPTPRRTNRPIPSRPHKRRACGFPMMKLVGLFCLASGALLQMARGQHCTFMKANCFAASGRFWNAATSS